MIEDIPDIVGLTRYIVNVQNAVYAVQPQVLRAVIIKLKRRIEAAPPGDDTTQYCFMLRAFEEFDQYRSRLQQFFEAAGKEGLFTGGDAEEYDRILGSLAAPDSTTKQ